MRTSLHCKPGRKGTKQLLAQYGDRLVCVRYWHDAQQKKRFKTVELRAADRQIAEQKRQYEASIKALESQIEQNSRQLAQVAHRELLDIIDDKNHLFPEGDRESRDMFARGYVNRRSLSSFQTFASFLKKSR